MERKIESIEITFENCEYVDIPISYVNHYVFNQINTSVYGSGADPFVMKKAKLVEIVFDRSIVDHVYDYTEVLFEPEKTIIDRLKYNDITSFRIHYDDFSYEDIYVEWDESEENEFINLLQDVEDDREQIKVTIGGNL